MCSAALVIAAAAVVEMWCSLRKDQETRALETKAGIFVVSPNLTWTPDLQPEPQSESITTKNTLQLGL